MGYDVLPGHLSIRRSQRRRLVKGSQIAVSGARAGTADQMAQGRLQLRVTESVTVTEQPPRANPLVCPGQFAGPLAAPENGTKSVSGR